MRGVDVLLCLLCVSLASVGQVLMRAAAQTAQRNAATGLWAWWNMTSVLAIAVYLSAMLLWLWVLGRVPLTQAITFFGLTFILVPLLAWRFLGDPLTLHTLAGGLVVLAGVMLANWR